MAKEILKFILAAFVHGILFIISLAIGLFFTSPLTQGLLEAIYIHQIFFHLLHFVICFLILYKQDASFFMHHALKVISSSLLLVTAIVSAAFLAASCLIYPLTGLFATWISTGPLMHKALVILFLCNWGLAYLLLAVQYLWLYHLYKLGYLEKRVLCLGHLDRRLSQDLIHTDRFYIYTGSLIKRGRHFYFNAPDGLTLKIKPSQIKTLILKQNITEVIIFISSMVLNSFETSLVQWLSQKKINYYLIPELSQIKYSIYTPASFPYLSYLAKGETTVISVTLLTCKRLLDLSLVILTSLFTLPLGLLIALLIKLKDRGPVFHIQQRVGLNGRIINFVKFRTMVVHAERLLPSLLAYNSRPDGPLFKMEADPRLTSCGRLLRSFALDELPQLLNVLKGELSLIGPRPHLLTEIAHYPAEAFLRLSCIPGIIGLPQLVDNGRLSFQHWLRLDLSYRKNWSLALDLKIIKEALKLILKPFLRILWLKP